jgi:hypothetical protein
MHVTRPVFLLLCTHDTCGVLQILAEKQSLAVDAWTKHKEAMKRMRMFDPTKDVQEEVDWEPPPSKKRRMSQ